MDIRFYNTIISYDYILTHKQSFDPLLRSFESSTQTVKRGKTL